MKSSSIKLIFLFVLVLLTVCSVSLLWILSTSRAETKPNIVFILVDDLGYNDVSYHGSEISTPNIDKLAAGGLTLENYYVQPICTPSRSQLMSGRYQIHTGLQHLALSPCQRNGLPLDSPTLADKLKEAGYATHMLGKWHLGFFKEDYLPYNRGFDTYLGLYQGGGDHYNHTYDYNEVPYLDLHTERGPEWAGRRKYSTHLFTQRAIDIINEHDKEKPLFLYLAHQAVHTPLQVPTLYEDKYKDAIQDKDRRVYAGMVTALDESLYNVTEALRRTDMWDNTLVIISTDNGGKTSEAGNNYPLRGEKKELWDGGIHGVGFVTGGALDPRRAGQVSHELLHISDWFPTLVRLAGGQLDGGQPLDGVDQWSTINSDEPSKRTIILHNIDPLWERSGSPLYPDTFDTSVRAAIRSGDWKLLTGDPGLGQWTPPPDSAAVVEQDIARDMGNSTVKNVWLFNITADPTEHNDLSDERPDVVRTMLELLDNFNKTAVPVRFPTADPNCDPALHDGIWSPWM